MLSVDRQSHFARVIVDGLWKDELLNYDEERVTIRAAKKAVEDFVAKEEAIDEKVREKVRSLKRGVMEGTDEWDIMYQKYYEEEQKRSGLSE